MNPILTILHTLLCFGAAPGEGNPAIVVKGDACGATGRDCLIRVRLDGDDVLMGGAAEAA